MNSEWQEISFENLCDGYKDNWQIQYKFLEINLWLDYDIKKATAISLIAFNQMDVLWRYKINK